MVRKTKEDALATRAQLLDAAAHAFSEQGVAHTTLSEIACSAGLTRGAVYWHFDNKADLLAALWERATLPMEQFEEVDRAHAADPLRRIREKCLAVLKRTVHDPDTQALLSILMLKCEWVEEIADARKLFLEEREKCLGKITAEFREAIAAKQLPKKLNPESAALGLFGLVDGLTMHWLFDTARFSLDHTAPLWVDAYLNGLRA